MGDYNLEPFLVFLDTPHLDTILLGLNGIIVFVKVAFVSLSIFQQFFRIAIGP